jgi:hypothetical protein
MERIDKEWEKVMTEMSKHEQEALTNK